MINILEVTETNQMIEQENLDVRTITMGISLLDCADSDLNKCCKKIYDKITVNLYELSKEAVPKRQECFFFVMTAVRLQNREYWYCIRLWQDMGRRTWMQI